MKGWMLLVLASASVYYLYTETDALDASIAEVTAIVEQAKQKAITVTGTKAVKAEGQLEILQTDIAERLSSAERNVFKVISQSQVELNRYKQDYCGDGAINHRYLSKENQLYICDKLN